MEVILTVILLSFLKTAWSDLFCSDLLKPKDQHFYPLRHCQRSNKAEISATNVVSVEKCAQYAESNDALAFNYGHGRKPKNETSNHDLINLFEIVANKNKTKNDEENTWIDIKPYFNCQILSCPEIGNLSGMINDTRYDYYTLYANPIPPSNATCLPSIGLFIYFNDCQRNYSQAADTCENLGGILATILSETRTNFLSSLVLEHSMDSSMSTGKYEIDLNELMTSSVAISIRHAFVGLIELKHKGFFFTSLMEPIECFRYRAWAPKYPSASDKLGCIAVTDSNSWKIFDCRKRMPFICELKTSGPSKFRVNLHRKCSVKRPNNRIA